MSDFEQWLSKKATGLKKSNGMHFYFLRCDIDARFADLKKRYGKKTNIAHTLLSDHSGNHVCFFYNPEAMTVTYTTTEHAA